MIIIVFLVNLFIVEGIGGNFVGVVLNVDNFLDIEKLKIVKEVGFLEMVFVV